MPFTVNRPWARRIITWIHLTVVHACLFCPRVSASQTMPLSSLLLCDHPHTFTTLLKSRQERCTSLHLVVVPHLCVRAWPCPQLSPTAGTTHVLGQDWSLCHLLCVPSAQLNTHLSPRRHTNSWLDSTCHNEVTTSRWVW